MDGKLLLKPAKSKQHPGETSIFRLCAEPIFHYIVFVKRHIIGITTQQKYSKVRRRSWCLIRTYALKGHGSKWLKKERLKDS